MPCAQSLLVWPQNQPTMVSQFEPQNRARGPGATGMRSGCNSGSFKVGGGARHVIAELVWEGSKAAVVACPLSEDT
jgi:hypothetical protein